MTKAITLTWRDENTAYRLAWAFRTMIFDADTRAEFFAVATEAGFSINDSLGCWISENMSGGSLSDELIWDFVIALDEAGFTVTHAGAVPDVVTTMIELVDMLPALASGQAA